MLMPRKPRRKPRKWEFRLYVADHSPRSMMALANLERMCKQYLRRGYSVRIIDVRKEPSVAVRDNILAIPTLKRVSPGPEQTVIGTLNNAQLLLKGLNMDVLKPEDENAPLPDVLNIQETGEA